MPCTKRMPSWDWKQSQQLHALYHGYTCTMYMFYRRIPGFNTHRTKKNFQQLEETDMDEEDQFPHCIPGWKNASKAAKSRMAAKYRRDKEGEYLDRLAVLLPFPAEVTSKLDKASILRLTITYLKLREQTDNLECGKYDWDRPPMSTRQLNFGNGCGQGINNGFTVKETDLMMKALGGFIIFVSRRGRILYVSDNVVEHIGFTQADMIGNKITAFMHHDDRREMCRQFAPSPTCSTSFKNALPCSGNNENCLLKEDDDPDSINPKTFRCERSAFYLRMRYQVVKEGSKTKHTGYMLTQWSGRIQLSCSGNCRKNCRRAITGMVALCRPMQSSSIAEIRLDGNMFMSRHNMDMKFTFCDPRILTLIGYEPTELLGRTAYDFHNPFDAQKIRICHTNLIDKGQSVSKYYRFLGKNGEWVWMQTRATIIYNTSNEPQYVVCMNYVIGQDEGRRHLMMEQEDLKDQEIPKGAIDVTSLSSPGPAHSSGYCSADEDHSYSSSKTRETYSPGLQSPTGTFSSLGSGGSQPHSPPLLPGVAVPAPTMVTPSMLEEKMQFSAEDLNLFDMIGEMLPPVTSTGLNGLGSGSLTDSWITGLNNDIEMMDVDQGLGDAADSEGLLMNLLKDSDRCLAEIQQSQQGKLAPGTTTALGQPITDLGMMAPPSTSTVITQSNVMLSSATQQTNGQLQSQTTCSKTMLGGINQLPSMSLPSSTLPLALNTPTLSNGVMANGTANLTVASFPAGILGMTSDLDGSMSENTREFSVKYAENIVDQQISATLANYFDSDNLMDSNTLGVQDTPMNGLSDPSYNLLGDSTNPSLSPFMPSTTASPPSLSISPQQQQLQQQQRKQPNCSSYQPQSGSRNVFATPAAPRQLLISSTSQINGSRPSANKSTSPTSNAPKTVGQGQSQHRPQVLKVKSHTPQRQQHKSSHNTSYPGLDDHRYTNKQLDSPPHHNNHHKSGSSRNSHHKSNNHHHRHHNHHNNHHHHHTSHSSQTGTHTPLLLERFLLTKEKLNPNKGSEAALATRGMSELHLGDRSSLADSGDLSLDSNQQLLKKLLTEEINPKDVQKAQQEVIMDRRLSASSSPTCSSPPLSSFNMDLDDLQQSIQLLGEDTSSEMDKVWAPPGGDTIPSELDEILQEERRQNDLWLQHCINELL